MGFICVDVYYQLGLNGSAVWGYAIGHRFVAPVVFLGCGCVPAGGHRGTSLLSNFLLVPLLC